MFCNFYCGFLDNKRIPDSNIYPKGEQFSESSFQYHMKKLSFVNEVFYFMDIFADYQLSIGKAWTHRIDLCNLTQRNMSHKGIFLVVRSWGQKGHTVGGLGTACKPRWQGLRIWRPFFEATQHRITGFMTKKWNYRYQLVTHYIKVEWKKYEDGFAGLMCFSEYFTNYFLQEHVSIIKHTILNGLVSPCRSCKWERLVFVKKIGKQV